MIKSYGHIFGVYAQSEWDIRYACHGVRLKTMGMKHVRNAIKDIGMAVSRDRHFAFD